MSIFMPLDPLTAATATQPNDETFDASSNVEKSMGIHATQNETQLRIEFLQKQLVDLDDQLPVVKAFYEERSRVLNELAVLAGTGHYFQSASGEVFKIVEETGKYVSFERFGYVRTKKPDESRGSLSMKEAVEAGFRFNDN